MVLTENLYAKAAGKGWETVGLQHHHGFCIPLFSIHSKDSCGIGEYTDLPHLFQFCKEIGFDTLQLLPLNDTGEGSSPYMALSAFALHPIYIGLHKLPLLERLPNYQNKLATLQAYTQKDRVDYANVGKLKREFLEEYALYTYAELSQQKEYTSFLLQEHFWLEDYALFKTLKEKNAQKSWEHWPEQEKNPTPQERELLLQEHQKKVCFHIFLQFLAFTQLMEVKKLATSQKIFLKGDIPILISRDSADVWKLRSYFLLDLAAGAPPDFYAPEGQYWGFPLYNWAEIEKSGYDFWKERLRYAASFYHIYRLDHVVGFFRLWGIPLNTKATSGFFVPSDESTWIPLGKKILNRMLSAVPILPIAEDLGTVPPAARACLSELGIPGTKVLRWERKWNEDKSYIPLKEYPANSMTTVSTHDSETLQMWWKEQKEEAKLYAQTQGWEYQEELSLEKRFDILYAVHHSGSLFHINLLPEYLAFFPELIHASLEEERINIPGTQLPTNWTYRLLPSVEVLCAHSLLKEKIKKLFIDIN